MKRIVIISAGDGGRVVSQLISEQGAPEILGFIDDNKALQGKVINGYKVIGTSSDLNKFTKVGFTVAVGIDMKVRNLLFNKAVKAKLEPVDIIHKTAVINKSAKIDKGIIILSNCVIGPFVKIGKNVFMFTGTIVEHDVIIEDNVYFSPGVSLAGHVKVGSNTFFGINSSVIEGVKIGRDVIVGAGSVVLKDIPNKTVVAGVPAKILRRNVG